MLGWSPILIQKIEIHALGFVLRKLQLNRHRDTEVSAHEHDFAQVILYLSGEGVQIIGDKKHRVRTGDLFAIPAGTAHGYATVGNNRQLSLVLDYKMEESGRVRLAHRRLPASTLNELHTLLTRVPTKGKLTLADYSAILAVVARLLAPTSTTAESPANPTLEKVQPLLRSATSLAKVARHAGYHPDHLNRKLKRETGLGLRALRDRLRLENAQQALRLEPTIAEAAAKAGFDDQNYFSRWFRQQTGQTPTTFRHSKKTKPQPS